MKKEISGYEGLYEIDENGTIYNMKKNTTLKHHFNETGYHRITLCKDGSHKDYRIHRLVAMMFIDNPKELPQVDHIDEDKDNNNVSNLRWCTNKENSVWHYNNNKEKYHGKYKPLKVTVNGIEFHSAYSAAKYIYDIEQRSSLHNISKEIRKYLAGNRPSWNMYGKYLIS